MNRIGAFIIALCILAIAGSLGLILFVKGGLGLPESVLATVSAILVITVMQIAASRGRERRQLGQQVEDLAAANQALQRQLAENNERMGELEGLDTRIEAVGTRVQERILSEVDELIESRVESSKSTLVSEMQVIETLVKQVAEGISGAKASGGKGQSTSAPRRAAAAATMAEEDEAPQHPQTPLGHLDDEVLLEMVRAAVEDNRLDLYLQPIVTLPQRRVRYYEALTRLRDEDGELIYPADYVRVAGPAGIMPMIDNLILFRSVQIVRRLTGRNRDVGVFCNMSPHSLSDATFFPQFLEFLQHNQPLAGSLFFEFPQAAIDEVSIIEAESMTALADLGFRFSMDHVERLDFNPKDLADRDFRFVKVAAELLLEGAEQAGAKIHPADLADLLDRYGLSLIAEKIENEPTVLDILDYDVRFGQGFLFSEPKPVRAEFLSEETDREASTTTLRKAG